MTICLCKIKVNTKIKQVIFIRKIHLSHIMSDEKITISKTEYEELKNIADAVSDTVETKRTWQKQGFTGYDEEIALCDKYLEKKESSNVQ